MPKILLIDSDTLSRRAISMVLRGATDYDIVAVGGDLSQINNTINTTQPDLVLLSLDQFSMAEQGIFQTIRTRFSTLPIVVLSNRDDAGAEAAISALEAGAMDFITKPVPHSQIPFAFHHFEERIISSVKTILEAGKINIPFSKFSDSLITSLQKMRLDDIQPSRLVVIGASLGGVHVLFELIIQLPGDLTVPIIIAQHAPKIYTRILANRLNAKSNVLVSEAYDGAMLDYGQVWIAPGGHHTIVEQRAHKNVLKVYHGIKIHNVRPSIDLLFESAANTFGRDLLGIILSGSGNDGIYGCRAIKNAGGQILVQDPRSCRAPHLSLGVLQEGFANGCFTPEELSEEILRRVKREKAL